MFEECLCLFIYHTKNFYQNFPTKKTILKLKISDPKNHLNIPASWNLEYTPWASNITNKSPVSYLSINVKPEEGGIPGICGAFDFSEEFLV